MKDKDKNKIIYSLILAFLKPSKFMKITLLCLFLTIYSLSFTPYFDPIRSSLDSIVFSVGSIKNLSIYSLLKRLLSLIVLFWVSNFVIKNGFNIIRGLPNIRASNKAIMEKCFQCASYFITFLISLSVLNIDMSHFAILSGAVGIGVGFGLQKITSNFISGFILSFEKSVEPGHLIEIPDSVYGIVKSTNARYTLVKAYDGREVIIPNEYFISQKVVNWTYSGVKARLDFTVGVAYESDINLAREIVLEVIKEHQDCFLDKEPKCYVKEFGDFAIQLFCTFWVKDIVKGRLGVKSDILLNVYNKFKDNNIEISYPKHVVHLHKNN